MLSGPTQYDSFRFATESELIFCILQYTLYLKRRFRSIISVNKKYGVRDEFRIFLFYSLIKPAIRKAAEPAHIRQGNRAVSTDVFFGKVLTAYPSGLHKGFHTHQQDFPDRVPRSLPLSLYPVQTGCCTLPQALIRMVASGAPVIFLFVFVTGTHPAHTFQNCFHNSPDLLCVTCLFQ